MYPSVKSNYISYVFSCKEVALFFYYVTITKKTPNYRQKYSKNGFDCIEKFMEK